METACIRAATTDDIDAICTLYECVAEEGVAWGLVASSREEIREQLGPLSLVAELDGHVIGYAAGSIHVNDGRYAAVTVAGERYLEVDDLYLATEFRNIGIGGRLLEALVDAAKAEGVTRVHVVSTTKDHDSVLRFYRRHGFQPWGVQLFR